MNDEISIKTQIEKQIEFILFMYAKYLKKNTKSEQQNDIIRDTITELVELAESLNLEE